MMYIVIPCGTEWTVVDRFNDRDYVKQYLEGWRRINPSANYVLMNIGDLWLNGVTNYKK